jgi:hypothetical protein
MFNEIYKCEKCNAVFDSNRYIYETGTANFPDWFEINDWNYTEGTCPFCDTEDCPTIELCSACGKYHEFGEMRGGVCPDCINRYRGNREACYEISQNTPRESIELNAFLLSLFTTAEIEDILLKHARDNDITDCDTFIDSDDDWFGEQVALREGAAALG